MTEKDIQALKLICEAIHEDKAILQDDFDTFWQEGFMSTVRDGGWGIGIGEQAAMRALANMTWDFALRKAEEHGRQITGG